MNQTNQTNQTKQINQTTLFSRSIMLYGREGFRRLQGSLVVVVGLGGVGSYAAEALVRAGIGQIRVVDCDVVKATDVNRQLFAVTSTVGRPKADAAAERLLDINPGLRIEALNAFFHRDTAAEVVPSSVDFVVDAIDSVNPKVELILYCGENRIPIVSSMGAAGRTDPSKIVIGPLDGTRNCPLARTIRRHLRRRDGSTDIATVFSSEMPADSAGDGPEPVAETSDTYLRGRCRRSLPSLSTIPAIFGLVAANYVIMKLSKGK